MSGAIALLPLCTCMAWTERFTFDSYFFVKSSITKFTVLLALFFVCVQTDGHSHFNRRSARMPRRLKMKSVRSLGY
jgi:hypothetical protein